MKSFESGMVVNPITIGPQATLADALSLMQASRISGIPVVENGGKGGRATGASSASSPIATCASPPIRPSPFPS